MSLLEALKSVKASDLEEVDGQIAELEKQLADLKDMRRVIAIKLGISKPKNENFKKGKSKAGPEDPESERLPRNMCEQYRLRIKEYLMANGPAPQTVICKKTGIPEGSISAAVNHEWFCKTGRGVELTRSLNPNPR